MHLTSPGRWVLALVAVALLAVPMPAAATVIFFDDFEVAGNGPPGHGAGRWTGVPNGRQITPGSGTVEVVGPSFYGNLCAGGPSPSHCVDLDGSTDDAGILTKDLRLGRPSTR